MVAAAVAGQAAGGGGADGDAMRERFLSWDANEDDLIVREEVPEQMRERLFDRADTNGDGVIDADELELMLERIGRGQRR